MTERIIKDFSSLRVYQKAHSLTIKSYSLLRKLPVEEKFCRTQQLRRSLSSIPANIAEGYGRYHYRETAHFLRHARGSLDETRSHIILARDLQQAPTSECNSLLSLCLEVRKLINGYIRYLQDKIN